MPTACVQRTESRTYCGEEPSPRDFVFTHVERAYQFYNKSASSVPDPKNLRLWACQKCLTAIEKDKGDDDTPFGRLIKSGRK